MTLCMRYVPSREASRILGVHPQTLRTCLEVPRLLNIHQKSEVLECLGQYCKPDSHCETCACDEVIVDKATNLINGAFEHD